MDGSTDIEPMNRDIFDDYKLETPTKHIQTYNTHIVLLSLYG